MGNAATIILSNEISPILEDSKVHTNMNNTTEKQPECFVSMWFGSDTDSVDEMEQLYDLVIKPAVESFNFKPYHVGKDDRANKLFDETLNAIDRAHFMVADLTHDPETGLRGSVLFEAGYAYRSKPVIWMCRKDLADKCTPFDAEHLKQVRWNKNRLKEAQQKLKNVIKARIKERGKQHVNHEVKRLFSENWKKIENATDILMPNATDGSKISANDIRVVQFEELCDDLKTRIDYKDMGLTPDDKYELIEMIRGWMKLIRLCKDNKKVPDINFYKIHVLPKLLATGWMDS